MNNTKIKQGIVSIKERGKIIVLITLLSIILSVLLTTTTVENKYIGSNYITISKVEGEVLEDEEKYKKLIKEYSKIIKSYGFMENTISRNSVGVSVKESLRNLKVIDNDENDKLEIYYEDNRVEIVEKMINAITTEFERRYEKLVKRGNVILPKVEQYSTKEIRPNIIKNILLSAIASLIMSLGLCIIFGKIDTERKEIKKVN